MRQLFVFLVFLGFQMRAQTCANLGGYAQAPEGSLNVSGAGVNKMLDIKVGESVVLNMPTTMSATAQTSSTFFIGPYASTGLQPSNTLFQCNNCFVGSAIDIATSASQVVKNSSLTATFPSPGIYYIYHNYTDGSGYVSCRTITVRPKLTFDYSTCNCNQVNVNVNYPENKFYRDVTVKFYNNEKKTILTTSINRNITNTNKYPFSPIGTTCTDGGTFEIWGSIDDPRNPGQPKDFLPDVISPIKFEQNRADRPNPNEAILFISHEKNGDLILKTNYFFEGLSYAEGSETGVYIDIPSANLRFNSTNREVTVSGVNFDVSKEYWLKPTISGPCGSLKKAYILTGQIKEIKTETNQCNNLVRKISLFNKHPNANYTQILVLADNENGNVNQIKTEDAKVWDDQTNSVCEKSVFYRSQTKVPIYGNTVTEIYSKPFRFEYEFDSKILPPLLQDCNVTIVDLVVGEQGQSVQYAMAPPRNDQNTDCPTNTQKFNIYRASLGTDIYTKINLDYSTSLRFEDKSTNISLQDTAYCYVSTYINSCGLESSKNKPICTISLNQKGNFLSWNKSNVSTFNNGKDYTNIIGYEIEEYDCVTNPCKFKTIANPPNNSFNPSEEWDFDPNVHSRKFRVKILTYPILGNFSNVYEYFYPAKLYVPGAFTPGNGDAHNERFSVQGRHVQNLVFEIFDRWGAKITTLTSLGEAWDGTIDGSPAPEGTYFYKARALDFSPVPKEYTQNGTFMLIR